MGAKNSNLTLAQELIEQRVSVPVQFLDTSISDAYIDDTDTLNIDCEYSTDGEELNDWGANTIIRITDPSKGWEEKLAFAISADFNWNN